jgi:hypothetical protein
MPAMVAPTPMPTAAPVLRAVEVVVAECEAEAVGDIVVELGGGGGLGNLGGVKALGSRETPTLDSPE